MRGRLVACVSVAVLMAGCPDPAPPPVTRPLADTGPRFFDAGPPVDGGSLDAFHWPDTGPALPPVVPQQSWTFDCSVGPDTFAVTLAIDARAESGIVRAVGGAGGRAASTIFDILPGGVLRARSPIPMGLPGDHSCSYDQVTVDQWVLQFDDPDGDGIRDHLASASSGSTVTRTGPTMPPPGFPSAEFVFVRSVAPDTRAPTIALGIAAPIARFDPIVVTADEPVEPSFMPRLVGPRTFALAPDLGASAPARWTLDTLALPVGHYTLELGAAPHDLAGMAAADLPTLALDVAEAATPVVDGIDPALVTGVMGSAPTTILGDDAGETALSGATSLLAAGRTVLVVASPAGRRNLTMTMRFEGPTGSPTVVAYITVFDDRGTLVGQSTSYQTLFPPATVAGFESESPVTPFGVQYTAARSGSYYVLVEPGGRGDVACTGVMPVDGIAVVLDDLAIF